MFWYITLMVGLTTLLFFYGLFHFLFMRNKRLEKRMKRYLEHSDSKKLDKKKLRSLVDIRLAREKLGKKVLSKEKSSKLEAGSVCLKVSKLLWKKERRPLRMKLSLS